MAKKTSHHPKGDENRIREEAHKLWEADGRPDGRADRHWAEAREIVALKDSADSALKPIEQPEDESVAAAQTARKQGDLPGMTDQGEDVKAPSFEAAAEIADEMPLTSDAQKAHTRKATPGGTAPDSATAPSPGTPASGMAGSKQAKDADNVVGRDAPETAQKGEEPAKAEKAKASAKSDESDKPSKSESGKKAAKADDSKKSAKAKRKNA